MGTPVIDDKFKAECFDKVIKILDKLYDKGPAISYPEQVKSDLEAFGKIQDILWRVFR